MMTAKRFIRSIESKTESVLITIALVSAFFTSYGVMVSVYRGDHWVDRAPAVVLGVGAFAVIFLFWIYAIGVVPRLASGSRRLIACAIVVPACGLILALSSWFNVAGLAGKEAINLDIKELVTSAENELERAHARTSAVRSLFPRLQQTVSWLDQREAGERENGESSGLGMAGPVSNTYRQAADSFRFLHESMVEALAEADDRYAEGVAFLDQARAASSDLTVDPRRRLENVSQAIGGVNGVLAGYASLDLLDGVVLGVESIPQTLVVPVNVRTEGQSAVIERIRVALAQRGSLIAEQAQRLGERHPAPQPVEVARRNPMLSVARHYRNLLPAWCAGIALDLMPLFLLAFGVIAASDERAHKDEEAPLARFTMAEFAASVKAYGELQRIMGGLINEQKAGSERPVAGWAATVNGGHHWTHPVHNGHGGQPAFDATWQPDAD